MGTPLHRQGARNQGGLAVVFDTNLQFRSTSASLTATETSATVEIPGGTPTDGLALVIDIPKRDVGDTLAITLTHSTDNSTFTTLETLETVASITATNSVPFKLVRRFYSRNRYYRTVMTVAGTSPDFGAVQARVGSSDEWNILSVGANATANP